MIVGGEGNDQVVVHRALVGNRLSIDTRSGDDVVFLGTPPPTPDPQSPVSIRVGGEVLIRMGAGHDLLRVGGTTVRGFANLNGGPGTNSFTDLGGNRWRNPRIVNFVGNDNGGSTPGMEHEYLQHVRGEISWE